MSKPMKEVYANGKVIGSYPMSNFGGLVVYDPVGDDKDLEGDILITAFYFGEVSNFRRSKIHYTDSGRAYINRAGTKFYLDQVIRVGWN